MAAYNQPYNGVSARITIRTASVCDSDHTAFNSGTQDLGNFEWTWSMIADTGAVGWLQSGPFRSYGTPFRHFAQYYNYYYGVVDVVGSTVNTGEIHQYWQQYLPDASGLDHSNVDTTRFINTSNLRTGWSGLSQQFFGETRYRASDVAGTSSATAKFDQLQVEDYSNVWHGLPNPFLTGYNDCDGVSDPVSNCSPARWAGPQPLSQTSFQIWHL
jgi:hypothetical protein